MSIQCLAPFKKEIVSVKQRDLFRKYGWPAAGQIKEKLELLKETLEE